MLEAVKDNRFSIPLLRRFVHQTILPPKLEDVLEVVTEWSTV